MKNKIMAQRVKDLRSRKGFSQEHLAEIAQINLRTVQRIEAGETEPRGDTLKRIANALGVNPDELLDWAEQEDNGFLAFLNVSALCFIAFPLLGIIVPLAIWMLKKDKIRNIGDVGKRLVNFQITWCLIVFLVYAIIFGGMIFNFSIPLPHFNLFNLGTAEMIIILVPLLYLTNGLFIIINTIKSYNGKKVFYQPAFNFLK